MVMMTMMMTMMVMMVMMTMNTIANHYDNEKRFDDFDILPSLESSADIKTAARPKEQILPNLIHSKFIFELNF